MNTIVAVLAVLSNTAPHRQTPAVRPPAPVRQAVMRTFPGVTGVEWKLKSDRFYEAEFTYKGADIAAKFDSTGAWKETEKSIPATQVPAKVNATIKRDFAGYKVVEIQTLTKAGTGPMLYELHFDNGKEIVKAQLDASGAIVSKSAKPKVVKPKK